MSLDQQIVRAAIHPAIGIARVGNSQEPDGYFYGPEVSDPAPAEPGFYKDRFGAIKRQAARFRVYGYNAAGEVVGELTPDVAQVEWTAHLANKKSAWYQFQLALDIPEAADANPAVLRNNDVADRQALTIDPGPRSITGRDRQGRQYEFDSGQFMGKQVYLGELRTDGEGRLIVLGGYGISDSYDGRPVNTFANNDGWHDDVADGPVTARVTVDGREIPVDPAWVAVAPPNYAPDLKAVRTLYDLLFDVAVSAGQLPFPATVSFSEHIEPILRRTVGLQWVNHGYATHFGHGGPEHYTDPRLLAKLASTAPEHAELRRQVFTALRVWDRDGKSPVPTPWIYGDGMAMPPRTPQQHMTLSPTHYRLMERWADGDFTPDYHPDRVPPRRLQDVPPAEQPAMLDRAALEFCLADAFHPGCEVTWPIRHATMFMAPFRIRHRPEDWQEPEFGTQLTPETALGVDGPLYAQAPGDLTRWMAVPWHTDTASCRSGYQLGYGPTYDPYLPTFWPANVPNHVLTDADYQVAIDPAAERDERLAAFERRAVWYRGLRGEYLEQLSHMISDWSKLGIVETRAGVEGDPDLPPVMLVESVPEFDLAEVPPTRNLVTLHVPEAQDAATAPAAVARAVERSGRRPEEVTAAFIAKLSPYRDAR